MRNFFKKHEKKIDRCLLLLVYMDYVAVLSLCIFDYHGYRILTNILSTAILGHLILVFLAIIFTITLTKTCHNAYKAWSYVALFLLCETIFGLMLTIIRTILPLFQTDALSTVTYNFVMIILICYMMMNAINHLQLIYWGVFKIEEKSLRLTAIMRAVLRPVLYISLLAIYILSFFIPMGVNFMLLLVMLHFFVVVHMPFLSCKKEAEIESKIITFINNGLPFYYANFKLIVFLPFMWVVLSIGLRFVFHVNIQFYTMKNDLEMEMFFVQLIFILQAQGQDYFLKIQMDHIFEDDVIEDNDSQMEANEYDASDSEADLAIPSIYIERFDERIQTRA